MIKIAEVPINCIEIDGYILTVIPKKLWLTVDGFLTEDWNERGIWTSPKKAKKALDGFSEVLAFKKSTKAIK